LAKLNINWQSMSSVGPAAVTTGESAEAAPAEQQAATADKPFMVYVMADDPTDSETRLLESVAFAKEQVGVGSKFFNAVKMTSGDAAQDRIIKEAGKSTPRIVFLDRRYKVLNVLEGNELSGGGIVKAMQQAVSKEYTTKFDALVKEYISLLNDLDRLESKREAIEDQKRRVAEKPNKSKEAKIERDEAEYKTSMEAWQAKEQKLLETRKFKGEEKPATSAEEA
jgi:hypothetical protein